jgi:MFS transporter, SP family, xylose:H+ symportor
MLFTPHSLRWLVAKRQLDKAVSTLSMLGTDSGNVEKEIADIQASLDLEHHTLKEPFYCKTYAKPIMLAMLIAVFNQLSGINAVLYYAPSIFRMAGAATKSAMLQSVIIGFTCLVFTIMAMAIIDHFVRKRLMVIGSIGYIMSLSAASFALFKYGTTFTPDGGKIVLGALILFIASHAFGQGAVIWVFISEIFPNRVRSRGQALGSFTHWVMAAAVSWTFKPITGVLGGGFIFAVFALMMVLQLLWVLFIMPETKGVPLEQIQKKLGIT